MEMTVEEMVRVTIDRVTEDIYGKSDRDEDEERHG
jgi:hypothetical protein